MSKESLREERKEVWRAIKGLLGLGPIYSQEEIDAVCPQYMDALRLKAEGKALTANGNVPLTEVLEEEVFEEADKRIDEAIKREVVIFKGKERR